MRKSYKTEVLVGWVVGWKKSTNSETTPHSFPGTFSWIVCELPIIRTESRFSFRASSFVDRNQGVPCTGKLVCTLRYRSEWLVKIAEAGVRRRAEFYYQDVASIVACGVCFKVRRDMENLSRFP